MLHAARFVSNSDELQARRGELMDDIPLGLIEESPEDDDSTKLRKSLYSMTGPKTFCIVGDPTLDPAHPREPKVPTKASPLRLCLQRLKCGFVKASFLKLYLELDTRGERAAAVVGAVLAVAAGLPLPAIFVVFSRIINQFPPDAEALRVHIAQLLGIAAAYFVVTTAYTCCFGRVGERIANNMREHLLERLLHLEQAHFDTHEIDVTGLLTTRIETIQVGTSEKAGIFLQSISYFVAAFVVGFVLNAKLTGILLAAVIPTMILIVATGSRWISKFSTVASSQSRMANGIAEAALKAIRIVQAYDIGEHMCQQYTVHIQKATSSTVRKQVVAACMLGCVYFVAYAANGLAFFVGSWLQVSDPSSGGAGTVYAVCLLILDASFILGQFAPFLEIFANAAAAREEIRSLTDRDEALATALQASRVAECFVDFRGCSITMDSISFSYPARPSQKVLDEISVEFSAGCLNAVVGTSGGGKSTIISLLLGVYHNYTGRITFGKHDMREIAMKSLRSQIAVVDQECVLFSGSVYDNICYGLTDTNVANAALRSRCLEAVVAAGVDFIDQLPNGLDTIVDNSLQLSGGQKQRICLARALIKRPAVLILDEPTSALDAIAEAKVAKTVRSVAESGTLVIMIAHRLSTVLDADKVFVLSQGKAVESGRPGELSIPGTTFNALLQIQYSGESPCKLDHPQDQPDSIASIVTPAHQHDQTTSDEEIEHCEDANPQGQTLRFRHLLRPERLILAFALLCSAITGSIILGEALAFGNLVELINEDSVGSEAKRSIDFYCLIFFVLACVALVTYSCSGSAFGVASTRFTGRVQASLLRNLLRQDVKWFSGPGRSVHSLMARLNTDTSNLASLSGVALGTIFTIMASIIGGIVLSLAVAWRIAIVLLGCVPVLAAAGYLRVRILAKSEKDQRNAYNEASSIAAESCRNIRTVATLGLQDDVLRRYRLALREPYRNRLRFTFSANLLLAFSFAITYFVYALAYWW